MGKGGLGHSGRKLRWLIFTRNKLSNFVFIKFALHIFFLFWTRQGSSASKLVRVRSHTHTHIYTHTHTHTHIYIYIYIYNKKITMIFSNVTKHNHEGDCKRKIEEKKDENKTKHWKSWIKKILLYLSAFVNFFIRRFYWNDCFFALSFFFFFFFFFLLNYILYSGWLKKIDIIL